MTISAFERTLNEWGQQRVPFLFVVDFEMQQPVAIRLSEVDPQLVWYDVNGVTNVKGEVYTSVDLSILKKPMPFEDYRKKFDSVFRCLQIGDSYLTNLTVKTPIEITASLQELFINSKARYKLLFDDEFLVFSPEIFVQIKNGRIYSYPMKGTISKTIPDAANIILKDTKELAEHVTIVDLIRNDLSQVATNVTVTRFRYIEEIATKENGLLQVSSEITGALDDPFSRVGTVLVKMLPAGSVSGAPKPRTVEIIREAEGEDRGYYTGVFGIFDGDSLDSGVMIRFIEKTNGQYFYRSGGGITTQSDSKTEFEEVLKKIYVPVN